MRIKTIWTLKGMSFREKIRRTNELIVRAIAHRVPKRFAYWVVIDVGARYILVNEIVPEVTYMTILERADKDKEYNAN